MADDDDDDDNDDLLAGLARPKLHTIPAAAAAVELRALRSDSQGPLTANSFTEKILGCQGATKLL